jgi:arylsulfatase
MKVWERDFTNLRTPNIYNLRADPFERGPEAFGYGQWKAERMFLLVPAQAAVAKWLSSFEEFPPRQSPASFSIDKIMKQMESAGSPETFGASGKVSSEQKGGEKSKPERK